MMCESVTSAHLGIDQTLLLSRAKPQLDRLCYQAELETKKDTMSAKPCRA